VSVTTSDAVPPARGSLATATAYPSPALLRQCMRRSVPLRRGSPVTIPCTSGSAAANAAHRSMSSAIASEVARLTLAWNVPSGCWPGSRRPTCCS
jgi:hypothetical protein